MKLRTVEVVVVVLVEHDDWRVFLMAILLGTTPPLLPREEVYVTDKH